MDAQDPSTARDLVRFQGAGESYAGVVLMVTQPLRTVQTGVRFSPPARSEDSNRSGVVKWQTRAS